MQPTQFQLEQESGIDEQTADFLNENPDHEKSAPVLSLLKMQYNFYEIQGFELLKQAVLDLKVYMAREGI